MDKTVRIFLLANLLLAIPSWVSFGVGTVNSAILFTYLAVWHLPVIFIMHRNLYSKRLVIIFAYVAMSAVSLALIIILASLGIWQALLNIYMYLVFLLVYLKFNYMLMLINYVRSGTTDELYT